jgi:uncharacterized membrane protein YkvA (DUF1232 family)
MSFSAFWKQLVSAMTPVNPMQQVLSVLAEAQRAAVANATQAIDDFERRVQAAAAHPDEPGRSLRWVEANMANQPNVQAMYTGEAGQLGETLNSFAAAYVQDAPRLMRSVLDSAQDPALRFRVIELFGIVGQYVAQEADFIPDNIGLIGFLDDAWVATTITLTVAPWADETQHFAIIGQALVNALPQHIGQALRGQVQTALSQQQALDNLRQVQAQNHRDAMRRDWRRTQTRRAQRWAIKSDIASDLAKDGIFL